MKSFVNVLRFGPRLPSIRRLALPALLTAALVLPCAPVRADVKIKLKPIVIVDVRYDSNFFSRETNEREVMTYLLAPGVELGLESTKAKVQLNYTLEGHFYDDVGDVTAGSDPADELDYIGHLAVLDAQLRPFKRLTFQLADTYHRTRTASVYDELTSNVISTDIERRKYDINRFKPGIFYDFEGRFALGARYIRTDRWYTDSDTGDYHEDRGALTLTYNPQRSLTLDLDYNIWTMDYDSGGSDYDGQTIRLLAQKRYKHTAFEAAVGWHTRSYAQEGADDQDGIPYRVAFTWQNPPPPESFRYTGSQFLRAKSHLHLAYERDYNNLGVFADYYSGDRFTLSLGRVFLDKIKARLRGWYQIADYENSDRRDDIYDVNAEVGYIFTPFERPLTLSLQAGRMERDSDEALKSFVNDYVMLRLNFDYDLSSRGEYSGETLYY